MKNEFTAIEALLEKKGIEFTVQRRRILEELFYSGTHLSVSELYERVKPDGIGLATVYRAMNVFSSSGLVKEINVGDKSIYELKIYSKKPLHIHFQCMVCNSIIDIDEKNISLDYLKLNRVIEEENSAEIHDTNIMLIGICNKCREERKCQGR